MVRSAWLICVLIATSSMVRDAKAQRTEYVFVQKVMDDKAVIVRSTGATYVIEKGVGCLSLWRYEGKRVIIGSPGLFLGVGSRLLIPDLGQECRIWDSKEIAGPGSPDPQTILPTQPNVSPSLQTDELTLYDFRGRATAYLDLTSDLTFYLWTGEPVAYLDEGSIYGFNGKHLGWYQDGIVYDHDGAVVAAPASAFRGPVDPAPPRGLRQFRPVKGLKELKPLRPLFGLSWTNLPARVFFFLGTT